MYDGIAVSIRVRHFAQNKTPGNTRICSREQLLRRRNPGHDLHPCRPRCNRRVGSPNPTRCVAARARILSVTLLPQRSCAT